MAKSTSKNLVNRTSENKIRHRNKLDKIFTDRDDIQLIRGILKHGKKWKLIWDTYDLKHINRMSLKDRARSKAFRILLERARKDESILELPYEVRQRCPKNDSFSEEFENSAEKQSIVENQSTENKQLKMCQLIPSNTSIPTSTIQSISATHSTTSDIEILSNNPNDFDHDEEANINKSNHDSNPNCMNMNLDVCVSDVNSLLMYSDLSPRLHLGGSILEDLGSSPRFASSTMSLDSIDVEFSRLPNHANYTEV